MKLSLERDDLAVYVMRQMWGMFPDDQRIPDLARFVSVALERCEHCFSRLRLKGYHDSGGPRFNHLHTDQYAVFLYYLANSAFKSSPGHPIAAKAYALNKALSGLDAFYEVELPDIFAVQHPVGTVLGRASYANYFLVYQNCTVGANLEGDYPSFGEGVVMYGGSRVIGKTSVGANSMVSAGAILIDDGDLPANSILHGIHPFASRSGNRRDVIGDIFGMGHVEAA